MPSRSVSSRTLAGLTSRWTMPASCAASSASPTWATGPRRARGSSSSFGLEQPGEVGAVDVAHRHVQQARPPRPRGRSGPRSGAGSRPPRGTRAGSGAGTPGRRSTRARSPSARPRARAWCGSRGRRSPMPPRPQTPRITWSAKVAPGANSRSNTGRGYRPVRETTPRPTYSRGAGASRSAADSIAGLGSLLASASTRDLELLALLAPAPERDRLAVVGDDPHPARRRPHLLARGGVSDQCLAVAAEQDRVAGREQTHAVERRGGGRRVGERPQLARVRLAEPGPGREVAHRRGPYVAR